MSKLKAVSLFSGIGGIDLGFEQAGIETVLQVEKDKYCLDILGKQWPSIRRMSNIKLVTAEDCAGANILYGGFPCQPVSDQGERRVYNDSRWLWPEFHRLINEVKPDYAVIENVPGLLKRGGGTVLRNLAESGYDAEWSTLTARAFGAPHHRERLFIIAYPCGNGRSLLGELARDTRSAEWLSAPTLHKWEDWRGWLNETVAIGNWNETQTSVLGVDDGLSEKLDKKRIKALGNAVVPAVAQYIGEQIVKDYNQQ